MYEVGIILAAGAVAVFAYNAWRRGYALFRADAKERAALALADNDPSFARAWKLAQEYGAFVHARPDYVVRRGR